MTYTITSYKTGEIIGQSELTVDQSQHLESMLQMPEGIIRLGAVPHDYYDLDAEYQDTHEDTTVCFLGKI